MANFSPRKNHWDDHIPKEKGKTIGKKRRKMKKEKERKTQKQTKNRKRRKNEKILP
jgi:hypothetical protein